MKIHTLEGDLLAWPAPSHSPGGLWSRKRPGNQGKVTPHHTSAATTAGRANLGQPLVAEGLRRLEDSRDRSLEWLDLPGGGSSYAACLPPKQG